MLIQTYYMPSSLEGDRLALLLLCVRPWNLSFPPYKKKVDKLKIYDFPDLSENESTENEITEQIISLKPGDIRVHPKNEATETWSRSFKIMKNW